MKKKNAKSGSSPDWIHNIGWNVQTLRILMIWIRNIARKGFFSYGVAVSVADPGSGAFLTPGSGIRDG